MFIIRKVFGHIYRAATHSIQVTINKFRVHATKFHLLYVRPCVCQPDGRPPSLARTRLVVDVEVIKIYLKDTLFLKHIIVIILSRFLTLSHVPPHRSEPTDEQQFSLCSIVCAYTATAFEFEQQKTAVSDGREHISV